MKFLFDNQILKNNPICEGCEHPKKLLKAKNRVNSKILRYLKKGKDKHDNKFNIRNGSIF